MKEVCADLTVYFQDPYWIGEYKRISGEKIETNKVFFDYEPLIQQVYNSVSYTHLDVYKRQEL